MLLNNLLQHLLHIAGYLIVTSVTLLLADYDVPILIWPKLCVMRKITTFENTEKQKYLVLVDSCLYK